MWVTFRPWKRIHSIQTNTIMIQEKEFTVEQLKQYIAERAEQWAANGWTDKAEELLQQLDN